MSAQLSHFTDLKKGHSVCPTANAENYQSDIISDALTATLAPSMRSAPRTLPSPLSRSNHSALRAAIQKMKSQQQITFMNTSSFGVAMSRI